MEGKRGGKTWRETLAGNCGGKNYYPIPPRMEAENLGGNYGRKLWGENVGGKLGARLKPITRLPNH